MVQLLLMQEKFVRNFTAKYVFRLMCPPRKFYKYYLESSFGISQRIFTLVCSFWILYLLFISFLFRTISLAVIRKYMFSYTQDVTSTAQNHVTWLYPVAHVCFETERIYFLSTGKSYKKHYARIFLESIPNLRLVRLTISLITWGPSSTSAV